MKYLLIGIILLTTGMQVHAGSQVTANVWVSNSGATGSLGSAASNGTKQYIYCTSSYGPAGMNAYCAARNEAGDFISCYTSNYTLTMIAGNLGGQSGYLHFVKNASGECTYIRVISSSRYL